jgi:hypothetical protein
MLKRILWRGEPVDGKHQIDANRRNKLMEAEITVSRQMMPISTGSTQGKQDHIYLEQIGHELTSLESRNFFENTESSTEAQSVASLRKQSQARSTAKSVNIATIGGAGFYHIAKTKKYKVFMTSLSEIEYTLETR